MITTTVDVALGARSYPIWIGAGLLADATRWRAAIRGRHVLVVTNETIAPLYLERVQAGLAGYVNVSRSREAGLADPGNAGPSQLLVVVLAERRQGPDGVRVVYG